VRPRHLAEEAASPDDDKNLVALLKTSTHRSEVVLTHSGTGALYLLLRLLAERQPYEPEVIIPALCCPAVYYAARAAGCKVVVADSDATNGNVDPASVELSISPRTVAVVAVYLYGRRPQSQAIRALLAGRDIVLIEDAAQALGTAPDWHSAAIVLSFSRGKILPAGGGGALALDEPHLAAALRNLAIRYRDYTPTGREMRQLCPPLAPWAAGGREPWSRVEWAMNTAPHALAWLFAQPMAGYQVERAIGGFPSLGERVSERKRLTRLYRAYLADSQVQILGSEHDDDVVWRLPVLLPDPSRRARAARALLTHGIFPVTLYEPLHRLYAGVYYTSSLNVAEDIGQRVLALDVTPGIKESSIELVTRLLREAAE
jgi:dTDP-4-amino-4,6-dideoxygalactose transaminase